jgi:diguanylate cyclase (GGDEF)-like protein
LALIIRKKERVIKKNVFFYLIIFLSLGAVFSLFSQDDSLSIEKIHLSNDERDFLDKMGLLDVMMDDDFAPVSYYDEKTGQYGGIAVDVLNVLSEILAFDYQIINDKDLKWSDKLGKIENGEINILGGVSRNREMSEYGYFAETPYFSANYALIKLIDNPIHISEIWDMNNFTIGLTRGISINDYILRYLYDDTRVIYFNSQEETLKAMKDHTIDLCPYNEIVFKEDFFSGKLLDYEVAFPIKEILNEYTFFCPKNEDGMRLVLLLNEGMKHIKIDEIISSRYQNRSNFAFYKEHLEEIQRKSTNKTIILVIFIISTIFGVGLAFFLRNESKRKEELIRELKKLHRQLELQASHDSLTGLPNRYLFQDRLHQILSLSKRMNRKFAILYMDLDKFKYVNDTHGHETGDILLKEGAKRLNYCVRDSDTVARLGGDEFIAILTDVEDSELPAKIAQRIIDEMSHPFIINGITCEIGISIGISLYPESGQEEKEIVSNADKALYRVKEGGRNSYQFAPGIRL